MRNINIWLLIVTAATVPPQSPAEDAGCSVCGDDKKVGRPNGVFAFPGLPSSLCGVLENAGTNGIIPLDLCTLLPSLVQDPCNCVPIGTPVAPVAPVTPFPTRAPGDVGCSVCGDDKEVGHPNSVNVVPGLPHVTCEELENAGATGRIPLDQCQILPVSIGDLCNCVPIGTPVAPATPNPTPSPPTPFPTGPCSICGEGLVVSNPNALFSVPGQPEISCSVLEEAGANGEIQLCHLLPALITPVCGCSPMSPTSPVDAPFENDAGGDGAGGDGADELPPGGITTTLAPVTASTVDQISSPSSPPLDEASTGSSSSSSMKQMASKKGKSKGMGGMGMMKVPKT